MRIFSDKICRENRSTTFFPVFFFSEIATYDDIMWKSIVEPGRPQMTIQRMRVACLLPTASNTPIHICNTHCFPISAMVGRKRFNVTSYIHFLSGVFLECLNLKLRLSASVCVYSLSHRL